MALVVGPAAGSTFNVSNTLGDHMVLQRGPQQAVVWGMGVPGKPAFLPNPCPNAPGENTEVALSNLGTR